MSTQTMEVDLSTKDALRALNEINHSRTVALTHRTGDPIEHGNAYEIMADGMSIGMFVNLYMDGTWTASANIALSGD
ncbi:hypothetical protein [Massilia sp. TN1-12]|uniref:hypothetical protein n=1 Tax=Massilia paldalensis TaxID=3377675 RepID=UPI00384BDB54